MQCLGYLGFWCFFFFRKIYSKETGEYFCKVNKTSQRGAAALCNALGVHATCSLHPNTYPSGPGKDLESDGKSNPINTAVALFQRTIISNVSLSQRHAIHKQEFKFYQTFLEE